MADREPFSRKLDFYWFVADREPFSRKLDFYWFVADQSERGQTDEQFPFPILILSGLRISLYKSLVVLLFQLCSYFRYFVFVRSLQVTRKIRNCCDIVSDFSENLTTDLPVCIQEYEITDLSDKILKVVEYNNIMLQEP